MSYLNPPRLHFAGRFQAAVSTVNNDPLHFDNATFKPEYQEMQDANADNGWWNPDGDAAWRLIACMVTTAWTGHDQPAAADDPIMKCLIADSDRSPPAKLVDLDPEQQLVSEVWGMEVRICRADGTNLLRARYETTAFADIWNRAAGAGGDGDIGAGAMYQSVLTDLEWGEVSASPFLKALKQAASDGVLSIKFNVDGYNMDFSSPEFTRGRIVGTIGPSSALEPKRFVLGRHFMAASGRRANFFVPAGRVNFCVAAVDAQAGKIVLDLGNALHTQTPGGDMSDIGTLALGAVVQTGNGPQFVNFGTIEYGAPGWYPTAAGIVTLPAGRSLTADELQAAQENPLVLATISGAGTPSLAIAEASTGAYVRADRFVFRLNPGETAKVRLFASQWGQPYDGARIVCVLDPSQLQIQAGSSLGPAPPIGTPQDVIDFPARVLADKNGMADIPIRVTDPGRVRDYIDGQIYGIRPFIEENLDYGTGNNLSPWEFVSLLVWSGFAADEPPTWHGSIEPILRQYANLYPVMESIVDLGDYDSVCANVGILKLVFELPVDNPNSMPVTRDLSGAKRKAILRWLDEPGADGKPRKGSPKRPAPEAVVPPRALRQADGAPRRGGKAAAAGRRLMLRNTLL